MSDLETYDSPQIKIVSEFVRGFRESDTTLLAKHLHKDFRRIIHPRSLGVPDLNREEWLENMAGVLSITTELEVSHNLPVLLQTRPPPSPPAKYPPQTIIHSVIEAPGTVIVHVRVLTRSDLHCAHLMRYVYS